MSSVFKYDIQALNTFTLELPKGAKVLTVQAQRGKPQMWALVNPKATKVKRKFICVGTGHEFSATGAKYLGTWQQEGGLLVLHLFEVL